MASKRAIRRKACGQKHRFASQEAAVKGIGVLRTHVSKAGLLLPYACRFCGGFHFGHPPARVRRAIGINP